MTTLGILAAVSLLAVLGLLMLALHVRSVDETLPAMLGTEDQEDER